MARTSGLLSSNKELDAAYWVASRGALVGAAKWGIFSAVAGIAAFRFSPIYRGLTLQFKVFLQMSGMCLGSMIEADRRLRTHEVVVRTQKRLARDAEVWRRYEEDFNLGRARPGPDDGDEA